MKTILTLALLAPAAALAHGGPEGHAHPHGMEGVALLVLAGLGIAAWRVFKR